MNKFIKGIVTAVCLFSCIGAFAFGGTTKASADLFGGRKEELVGKKPKCALFLEEEKIKNMDDWGYYEVVGRDCWYFAAEGVGGQGKNPEIRFITEGTQTKTKPYTYAPVTVTSFSFEYCIENSSTEYVDDQFGEQYIVQILCSDGSYPIVPVYVIADGAWHTITIEGDTQIQSSDNPTYFHLQDLFSGFLFKMGGLDGELLISNIQVFANGYLMPSLGWDDEEEETSEIPEVSEESAMSETPKTSEEPATSENASAGDLTEEPGAKGCGSSISLFAPSVFTLLGAVCLLRRKEN